MSDKIPGKVLGLEIEGVMWKRIGSPPGAEGKQSTLISQYYLGFSGYFSPVDLKLDHALLTSAKVAF